MSFFKRNDPTAPAARRAATGSAPVGSPYERLPADGSYTSPQTQPGLPPRRSPAPPSQPDFSTPYHGQQRSQPSSQDLGRGSGAPGGGYDQDQRKPAYGYPSEKAEYRPQQPTGRGQPTGSGRGMSVPVSPGDLMLTSGLILLHARQTRWH